MNRAKAYSIITRIICEGKNSNIGKEYPELHKFITKDNYVDSKKFNMFFPVEPRKIKP